MACFVGKNVDTDIHNFWKSQNEKFPLLSQLARRQTLCIPASSANSERVFNIASIIIEERRSCLNGEIVNSFIFLHDFYTNTTEPTS